MKKIIIIISTILLTGCWNYNELNNIAIATGIAIDKIENIEVIYDKKYENIEKINLKIKNNNINDIEKIEIGNNNIKQENENFDDIRKYISENYNITNINIT